MRFASAVKHATALIGGQSALARQLEVTPQAVQGWVATGVVPAKRVIPIEKLTGISRHDLRPDLYPRES